MSQVVHSSDELYQKLAEQVQQPGQPVDSFVEQWLAAAVQTPSPDAGDDEDERTSEVSRGGE